VFYTSVILKTFRTERRSEKVRIRIPFFAIRNCGISDRWHAMWEFRRFCSGSLWHCGMSCRCSGRRRSRTYEVPRHGMPCYKVPRHGMPCYEVPRHGMPCYEVRRHRLPSYEVPRQLRSVGVLRSPMAALLPSFVPRGMTCRNPAHAHAAEQRSAKDPVPQSSISFVVVE
jgi:hypothetical protein